MTEAHPAPEATQTNTVQQTLGVEEHALESINATLPDPKMRAATAFVGYAFTTMGVLLGGDVATDDKPKLSTSVEQLRLDVAEARHDAAGYKLDAVLAPLSRDCQKDLQDYLSPGLLDDTDTKTVVRFLFSSAPKADNDCGKSEKVVYTRVSNARAAAKDLVSKEAAVKKQTPKAEEEKFSKDLKDVFGNELALVVAALIGGTAAGVTGVRTAKTNGKVFEEAATQVADQKAKAAGPTKRPRESKRPKVRQIMRLEKSFPNPQR